MVAKIRKYFIFKGKATRLEFWIGFVFIPPVGLTLSALFGYLLSSNDFITSFIIFIAGFVLCLWLVWATAVRRCHDLCVSSNYILLFLIPIISTLTFLVFAFAKGEASKLVGNTKLKQLKRMLRWHLKALTVVVVFGVVIFLIKLGVI